MDGWMDGWMDENEDNRLRKSLSCKLLQTDEMVKINYISP